MGAPEPSANQRRPVDPDRVDIILPEDFRMPPGGLHIRWPDGALEQEARLMDYKWYAALAYVRANRLNHNVIEGPHDRFGIIASGKGYNDTRQALHDLGLDDETCRRIGLRLHKVNVVWPLEATTTREFAEGLDEILVVEEKRQVIEYQIERGERHKVVAITIEGNRYFNTETLKERMYLRPASFLQFRHGRYSESFLERDVEAIESLYRSNGFRDVEVTSEIEHGIGGKANQMAIRIRINEGPQWLVEKLNVQGASEDNAATVLGMIQSQEGQPFSEFNSSIDRDNILDYYYNLGYPDAAFTYTFKPAQTPNRMILEYRITEGPQRFVRDVLIAGGLETTDEALVRDRLLIEPGDELSRSRILETQRRLYDLGIFARVNMSLQNPEGDEPRKYVLMDFEEARKWSVTGGVGAEIAKIGGCSTCLDAPAGSTGFSPRVSFGVTRRNFLGNGHIISFQSRASTLLKRGVLSYNAPQFRGDPDINLLFSGVYDDSRDVRTYSARRREGSVQIGQRWSRASTMLYRITYRRVSISDLKISDPVLIPQFLQPVRLGIVAGTYIQDRRDDPTDSHRGIYNTLDFGWATRLLASQEDFTRVLGHNATYHPFGLGSRYVLARSLTFGWMQKLGKTREIPLPERFFGGGPTSHRGFPSNQAGPRDLQSGFPLGGSAVLLNQVEFRYPLIGENISGSLFLDSGNVYSDLNKISLRVNQKGLDDFNYMVHALGFGLRYRTPVGPVRVDLAYSINPPRFFGCHGTLEQLLTSCPERRVQQISRFQFHFSLGQAF
jgi:outer membrane protein assembly complex protein YaeT